MKSRVVIAVFLLLFGVQLFAQSSPKVLNHNNPPAFQKYAAPVSGRLAFLASEKGKQTLLLSPNPIAKVFLQRYFGKAVANQWGKTPHKYVIQGHPSPASSRPQGVGLSSTAPVSRCPGQTFNRESAVNAMPQNEQSIAFKFQGGSSSAADMAVEVTNDFRGFFLNPAVFPPSISGYSAVTTAGCSAVFEGATPPIPDPFYTENDLIGAGDPIINYNPNNESWYYSSIYESPYSTGVGVFLNTTANLKNTTTCPTGTHNLTGAISCWSPANAIVADEQDFYFTDKPDSWVDTRSSGTGAGDVYITDTLFGYGSTIDLLACTSNLSACSPAQTVSGYDYETQFSDIKTTANGNITITYGDFYEVETFTTTPLYAVDIKYVVCSPNGAPSYPTCNWPVLVATDYFPIVDGLASLADVRNSTYPVHVEAANGTYVFWEHCGSYADLPFGANTVCPDADIVGAVSTNSSSTAPTWKQFNVDVANGHQIQPWASYDTSADKVVIAYQDCDAAGKTACRAGYKTIVPTTGGSTTVTAFAAVSAYAYPEDEANATWFQPLFGDYIGVSAHNGHAWFGYTDTNRSGVYGFGTKSVQQSDNNVAAWDNP